MSLFETSRTENEVFEDLEALCAMPGYIHALAALSFNDNFISYDGHMTSEAMATSRSKEKTIRTEFTTLLGLMLKNPMDFSHPTPPTLQEMLDKTTSLLEELHACLNQPMMASISRSFEAVKAGLPAETLNPFKSGEILREPIFYGGESAYNHQYLELAVKRYTNDNDWLANNKGFTIQEAYAVLQAISSLQTRKVVECLSGLRKIHPSLWTLLPGFTFSLSEIANEAKIEQQTAVLVLAAFTSPAAPTNANFTSLSEFNLANAQPILRAPNGDYISLQTYNVDEALYDSPFYWMAEDQSYKNTAFFHRGDFTEKFVTDRLVAVFGPGHVHRNVTLTKGRNRIGEIDVLVLFADRAVVVQCKSKKLTLEARKGNDLQIQSDFKKAVQNSYDQAYLCAKFLSDKSIKLTDGNGVNVEFGKLTEIYPLCVVSDHYPALSAQAREFLKFDSDSKIQPPLVTDVFFVDVLSEMLSSPLQFLSYVNRRVNFQEKIIAINEITILSHHLRSNLWIDDDVGGIMLTDDLSIDLDTAFTVRRQGIEGTATPKGILTHIEGTLIGRILRSIERRAEPELVDLGFMLLKLSGDALKDLDRGLTQISQQTRRDGKAHDFSLVFGKDAGITIHCSNLPNAEAASRLANHCELRKYAQRSERWFGLAIRTDDGLPKFGLNLNFPWRPDSALDEATKGMDLVGTTQKRGNVFRRRKIGRNEPCPCGSGSKFKKCCIERFAAHR